MFKENLQDMAIDWVIRNDPNRECDVNNTVIKIIEECIEFLRADDFEQRLDEMADILICAVQAASQLTNRLVMYEELQDSINKINSREYFVQNGKIMRLKDGKVH